MKENAEKDFAAFSLKIIRTEMPLLGVRTEKIKTLAKKVGEDYFSAEPQYYEELLIRGFALGRLYDSAETLFPLLPAYLNLVDNWAAIDSPLCAMKAFKKDGKACYSELKKYLFDERTFFARFAIVALTYYYTDEEHIDEVLELYASVPTGRYYADMATAWGLSVAAVKFYDKTFEKLSSGVYGDFVTAKAVSKCRDSFRIAADKKAALSALLRQKR